MLINLSAAGLYVSHDGIAHNNVSHYWVDSLTHCCMIFRCRMSEYSFSYNTVRTICTFRSQRHKYLTVLTWMMYIFHLILSHEYIIYTGIVNNFLSNPRGSLTGIDLGSVRSLRHHLATLLLIYFGVGMYHLKSFLSSASCTKPNLIMIDGFSISEPDGCPHIRK